MKLSVREEQVLILICEGFGLKEISVMMGLSYHSIRSYTARIRVKSGRRKLVQLAMWAIANGVVEVKKRAKAQNRATVVHLTN